MLQACHSNECHQQSKSKRARAAAYCGFRRSEPTRQYGTGSRRSPLVRSSLVFPCVTVPSVPFDDVLVVSLPFVAPVWGKDREGRLRQAGPASEISVVSRDW